MKKELILDFYTPDKIPQNGAISQYLIFTKKNKYYVVVTFTGTGYDFIGFQGWDKENQGEYIIFKPDDYKLWAELPPQLPR